MKIVVDLQLEDGVNPWNVADALLDVLAATPGVNPEANEWFASLVYSVDGTEPVDGGPMP